METISNRKAILIGLLAVNVPGFLMLFGPMFLIWEFFPKAVGWQLIAFSLGFVFGWLWWSVVIPKWRLWAYQHVESVTLLKAAAVKAQLIWPEGSLFERTEIKSANHAAREKELERERQ